MWDYVDVFTKKIILLTLLAIISQHWEIEASNNGSGLQLPGRTPRVTGRIVKVYSGARTSKDAFTCKEEGFFKDPTICETFYRCASTTRGKFITFRFHCGPGTIYDHEKNICNYPVNTRRAECGGLRQLKSRKDDGNENEISYEDNNNAQAAPSPITTKKPVTQNTNEVSYNNVNQISHDNSPESSYSRPVKLPQSNYQSSVTNQHNHLNNDQPSNSYPTTIYKSTLSTTVSSYSKVQYTTSSSEQTSVFDTCTADGFIGDSKDCNKFYRCVANGKGGFIKYNFACSEPTIWDNDIQACNHKWAVKNKNCSNKNSSSNDPSTQNSAVPNNYNSNTLRKNVLENQISKSNLNNRFSLNQNYQKRKYQQQRNYAQLIDQSQQSNNMDSGYVTKTSSTESYGFNTSGKDQSTTKNNDYDSSTTLKNKPNNEGKCTSGGFMADPNDCKKFYRCVDNGKGGFTTFEFSCSEGTVWDQGIQNCNHAWAVKQCGLSKVTEKVQTSTGYSNNFQEQTTQSTMSSTPKPSPIFNSPYNVQSDEEVTATTGHTITTQKSSTSNNMASENGYCSHEGFFGDTADCQKFFRCVSNGKGGYIKYEFSCAQGTVWDSEIQSCNYKYAVKMCGNSQTLQSTIASNQTPTSEKPSTQKNTTIAAIKSTKVQSTTKKYDSDREENNINREICTEEGFMSDSRDCKKFYRCVSNGNAKFIRYEFSCAQGTVWDSEIHSCNHESAVKTCGESNQNPTIEVQSSTNIPKEETTAKEITINDYSTSTKHYEENQHSTITASGDTCRKEGFKGDSKDCKKFYRCVNNGKGDYIRYEFSCGQGTVWDPEIESCNHEWTVKSCGGQLDPQPQEETDTTITQRYSSSSTSQSVHQATQILHDELPNDETIYNSMTLCNREGFIGDSKDCKKFYRCVDNGKGGFTKYEFSCGQGTIWDPDIQSCNHEWAVKNCGSYTPSGQSTNIDDNNKNDADSPAKPTTLYQEGTLSTTTKREPTMQEKCNSEGFFGDSSDCKKFYRCVDNGKGGYTKYDFSCGEGTVWDEEISSCNHVWAVNNPTCSSQNVKTTKRFSESNDQSMQQTSAMPDTSSKPPFHQQSDEIIEEPNYSSGICTNDGFFENPNDCKKFYRCVDNGKGGYTKYDFSCGEGTVWDQEILGCNHPSSAKSCTAGGAVSSTESEMNSQGIKQPPQSNEMQTTSARTDTLPQTSKHPTTSTNDKCTMEGFYGNSKNCKKFYRCVDNGKGGLTKYDFDCAEGTIWDQDVLTCNHPSSVENPSCSENDTSSTVSGHTEITQSTTHSLSEGPLQSTSSSPKPDMQTTSESKKKDNITCPNAGYFANPNDCHKFYRCVDWDGNGERISVFHFTCGDGTIWDPALQTCNYESAVYPPRDCTQSQSAEIETTSSEKTTSQSTDPSTTSPTTTTLKPTDTTTQEATSTSKTTQTTTKPTTQQTTTTTTKSTTEATTEAKTEPTTKYSTTTTKRTSTQSPTTTSQAPTTTSQAQTTTSQAPSTTSQATTKDSTTGEESQTQGETTTYQPTSMDTTTQGSTTKSQSETTSQDSTSTEKSEPDSTTTSDASSTEVSTSSPSNKECPETEDDQNIYVCPTGFRRHPKYCNLFYQCTNDDNNDMKIVTFNCPNDTIYDEQKTQCLSESETDQKCEGEMASSRRFRKLDDYSTPPLTVSNHTVFCPAEGFYPLERDEPCSRNFLRCRRQSASGAMRPVVHQCPEGFAYWPVSRRCERIYRVQECRNRSDLIFEKRWNIPIEKANVSP